MLNKLIKKLVEDREEFDKLRAKKFHEEEKKSKDTQKVRTELELDVRKLTEEFESESDTHTHSYYSIEKDKRIEELLKERHELELKLLE